MAEDKKKSTLPAASKADSGPQAPVNEGKESDPRYKAPQDSVDEGLNPQPQPEYPGGRRVPGGAPHVPGVPDDPEGLSR